MSSHRGEGGRQEAGFKRCHGGNAQVKPFNEGLMGMQTLNTAPVLRCSPRELALFSQTIVMAVVNLSQPEAAEDLLSYRAYGYT